VYQLCGITLSVLSFGQICFCLLDFIDVDFVISSIRPQAQTDPLAVHIGSVD
jgi:hypothetical protein